MIKSFFSPLLSGDRFCSTFLYNYKELSYSLLQNIVHRPSGAKAPYVIYFSQNKNIYPIYLIIHPCEFRIAFTFYINVVAYLVYLKIYKDIYHA